MSREDAIAIIQNEIACVKNNGCDRVCGNCSLAKTEREIVSAFELAIKVLEEKT